MRVPQFVLRSQSASRADILAWRPRSLRRVKIGGESPVTGVGRPSASARNVRPCHRGASSRFYWLFDGAGEHAEFGAFKVEEHGDKLLLRQHEDDLQREGRV
jgi:hypothetical protein